MGEDYSLDAIQYFIDGKEVSFSTNDIIIESSDIPEYDYMPLEPITISIDPKNSKKALRYLDRIYFKEFGIKFILWKFLNLFKR